MIFLIGGAPRVGKSIIGKHWSDTQKIPLVTTDDLCCESPSSTNTEEIVPVPPFSGNPSENRISVTERIHLQKAEARRLEPEIWHQLEKAVEQYGSVIIEGIRLWPDFLKRIEDRHGPEHTRIVLIGSTDSHIIIQGINADKNESNWLRESPAAVIQQVADFTVGFSRELITAAKQYSLRYVERTSNFKRDMQSIEDLFILQTK